MGNRLGRSAALLAAIAAASALVLAALQLTVAAASSVPTFGNPTINGVQGTGFEKGARVDPSGRVYTSGSWLAVVDHQLHEPIV